MDPISLGLNFITKIADKIWPDPATKAAGLLELERLRQTGELAYLTAETELAKGQLEINKAEAENANWFVSGWRPFVGWGCGFGLVYAALIEPFARFAAVVIFDYKDEFPVLDTTITTQVLFGMLGLGAMRSFDKKAGASK
jgi:hypothetical protein